MSESDGSGGATATTSTIHGGQGQEESIPRSEGPMPKSGGGGGDGDQRCGSGSSGARSVVSDSGTLGTGSRSASSVIIETAEKKEETAGKNLVPLTGAKAMEEGDSVIAKRLARPDYEADVKQFVFPLKKMIGEWMVKRVVSPFEFYLEFMFDEQIGGGALTQMNYHKWWPLMQKFYDDPEKRDALTADHDDLHDGHCFVLQEPEVNNPNQFKWHRIRILKLDPPKKQALVFFCDIGKRGLVPCSRLFLLASEFAKYDAHLFRCYLHNVLPATFGKTLLDWSMPAVAYFKDLMSRWEGKRFSGVVLSRSGTAVQRCLPDGYQNLGIVLFDMGSSKDKEPSCTVNALMVKSGHATATGLFSTCGHQLGRPELREGKHFNENEFRRRHPNLKQKPAQRPTCIPNILRTDEYNKAVQLYAADTMPEITWHPAEHKEKLLRVQNEREMGWLPTTVRERIAHVKINYSKGPNYIIMNVARESKSLSEMEDAIARTLHGTRPLTEVEPGLFVAYKVEKAGPPILRTCHRGLILSSTEEDPDFYNVLAVDHGNEAVVHRSQIFKLEDYFLEIPSFAIRAHLAVPGVVPGKAGSGWSAGAKEQFNRYLMTWDPKKPAYFAFRPIGSEWIELDSLRQEVVFKPKTKKWVAGPHPARGTAAGDELASFDLKKFPLLKSLHRSVGIHIKYEVKVEYSPVWHFADLHDQLLSSKEITFAKKARTDTRMHLDILDEWEIGVLSQANFEFKR